MTNVVLSSYTEIRVGCFQVVISGHITLRSAFPPNTSTFQTQFRVASVIRNDRSRYLAKAPGDQSPRDSSVVASKALLSSLTVPRSGSVSTQSAPNAMTPPMRPNRAAPPSAVPGCVVSPAKQAVPS